MSLRVEGSFNLVRCDFVDGTPEKPKLCLSFLSIRENGRKDFIDRTMVLGWEVKQDWLGIYRHCCPDHSTKLKSTLTCYTECPLHTKEENCDCDK